MTETFTAGEKRILSRHFTNLDKPVFALVNLPEVVKGALFARYSRSPLGLRRLFLEEFADDLDADPSGHRQRNRRPTPGGGSLRPCLPGVRRRLGGSARRCAPRLRAGIQPAHQSVGTRAPDVLSGAEHTVRSL